MRCDFAAMSKELRDALKHIVKKPKASEKLHAAIDALEKAAASDSDADQNTGGGGRARQRIANIGEIGR